MDKVVSLAYSGIRVDCSAWAYFNECVVHQWQYTHFRLNDFNQESDCFWYRCYLSSCGSDVPCSSRAALHSEGFRGRSEQPELLLRWPRTTISILWVGANLLNEPSVFFIALIVLCTVILVCVWFRSGKGAIHLWNLSTRRAERVLESHAGNSVIWLQSLKDSRSRLIR